MNKKWLMMLQILHILFIKSTYLDVSLVLHLAQDISHMPQSSIWRSLWSVQGRMLWKQCHINSYVCSMHISFHILLGQRCNWGPIPCSLLQFPVPIVKDLHMIANSVCPCYFQNYLESRQQPPTLLDYFLHSLPCYILVIYFYFFHINNWEQIAALKQNSQLM